MTVYSVALFLHIVGALLLFALLTIEGLSLRQGTTAARFGQILGPISALLIFVPGLYLVASQWGWKAWIVVGIATWVLIALGGALTGIGLMTLRLSQRVAMVSWLIRVGMALGVVFIMTTKPEAVGALVAVAAGALLGAEASAAVNRQVSST
jgi:hypothetical protein